MTWCIAVISHCFFFNDTATTEIYTLSLHDALPICGGAAVRLPDLLRRRAGRLPADRLHGRAAAGRVAADLRRSEEHTSELQSRQYLVCRLLLEKKTPHSSSQPGPRRCEYGWDARSN